MQILGLRRELNVHSIGPAWKLAHINHVHAASCTGVMLTDLVARVAACLRGTPAELLSATMPQQVHCSMMIGADESIGALTVPSTVLLPEGQNLLLVTLSKQLERSRAAICGCLQSEILPLARATGDTRCAQLPCSRRACTLMSSWSLNIHVLANGKLIAVYTADAYGL